MTHRRIVAYSLLTLIFSILIISFSTGHSFAYAVSDQSNTWYGDMKINLSNPLQSIMVNSTGSGPFSFTVGNNGIVNGTGSISINATVSGIYKSAMCNGTGLYVWNYNMGGNTYGQNGTANLVFTFVSSNVQGDVLCQGKEGPQTVPLVNSPVNTFGPQNFQIKLDKGASVDSPFLGKGDLKIELTGTNSSLYSGSNSQQSIVQPSLNSSTSIPEFGSLAGMIIMIALVGIIVISRKFNLELK